MLHLRASPQIPNARQPTCGFAVRPLPGKRSVLTYKLCFTSLLLYHPHSCGERAMLSLKILSVSLCLAWLALLHCNTAVGTFLTSHLSALSGVPSPKDANILTRPGAGWSLDRRDSVRPAMRVSQGSSSTSMYLKTRRERGLYLRSASMGILLALKM